MAMFTIIIKNSGGSPVLVEDLGISIPATGQVTMSDQFTYDELAGSDDLRSLVGDTTLVLNDGSSDRSAADGVNYLTFTQGLHVDGGANKHDASEVDVEGSYTNFDTGDLESAISSADTAISAAQSDATQAISDAAAAQADIDSHVDGGANKHDASEVDVEGSYTNFDTGDLESAISSADTAISAAQSAADAAQADIDSHIDGGANKHDASEIDVEGTYTYISTGDLETALGDIDTQLSAIGDGNTLDGAYDEGGAGSGRTITADSGSVKIDTASATTAALEIVPKAAAPSTGLAGGQIFVDSATGIPYIYDATRSKWLSTSRFFVAFGRDGKSKDQYLNIFGGDVASNNSGLKMLRDATIIGLAGQIDASGTCDFRVRKDDSASNITSLSISAALGATDATINVDVDADSFLQTYIESSAGVDEPMLMVEIAWRKDVA